MTAYRDALTRAVEAAAAPGRRTIIDALADDSACLCERPNAKPRKWHRPVKGPGGRMTTAVTRGFFCDDCEVALDLARRHLVAGLVTKAGQALERVAS